jgi:molybdopterin molybdotransferase
MAECCNTATDKLISVAQAEEIVMKSLSPVEPKLLGLEDAFGRILREDLLSDRDMPPFDRVAMDGIALRYDTWAQGSREFPIAGVQGAGQEPLILVNHKQCFEIMTGAVLPSGCDTVLMIEDLLIEDGVAKITRDSAVKKWQNVHRRALDRSKGDTIVSGFHKINSPLAAVAATFGKSFVLAADLLNVKVFSTGNELVDVSTTPLAHQIRRSNSYAMLAALKGSGLATGDSTHLEDSPEKIMQALRAEESAADIFILSGGISKGKFDFIPDCLADFGVELLFRHVAQRPGKPMCFGVKKRKNDRPLVVFALPGNPVSSLSCFHRYVIPAMQKMLGIQRREITVELAEKFSFKKALCYFLPVKMQYESDAVLRVYPVKTSGSGDFAPLVDSDGFVQLPAGETDFPAGYKCRYFSWE